MRPLLEDSLPPDAVAEIQERLGGGTAYRVIRSLVKTRYHRNVSVGALSAMSRRMGIHPRRATKAEVAAAAEEVVKWPKRPIRVAAKVTGLSESSIRKIRLQRGISKRQTRNEFDIVNPPKRVQNGEISSFDYFVECISMLRARAVCKIFRNTSLSRVYYWQKKLNIGDRMSQQLTPELMRRCGDRGWLILLKDGRTLFGPKIAGAAELLGVSERVLRYHLEKAGIHERQHRSQNAKDLARVRRMAEEAAADDRRIELEEFAREHPELEAAIQANQQKWAEQRRACEAESRVEVSDEDTDGLEGPGAPGPEVYGPDSGGDSGLADSGADSPPPPEPPERNVDRVQGDGPERSAEASNFKPAEEVHAVEGTAELHEGLGKGSIPVHDDAGVASRVVRLPRKRAR